MKTPSHSREAVMFRYTLLLVAIAFIGYGIYRIDSPYVYVGAGCFTAWLLVGFTSTTKGDDS